LKFQRFRNTPFSTTFRSKVQIPLSVIYYTKQPLKKALFRAIIHLYTPWGYLRVMAIGKQQTADGSHATAHTCPENSAARSSPKSPITTTAGTPAACRYVCCLVDCLYDYASSADTV